jgi:two-component system, chemotaxis family, response regulator WspR
LRHHSATYLYRQQRDEAYRALHESQRQLVEMNLELQRLTNMDGLTGLSNRRSLNEHLDLYWKVAVREQAAFSILMIDVDNFKQFNDTYGHLAGDDALKQIAAAIVATFRRPTDIAARFGGEEFIVLLANTPAEPARVRGDALCKRVANLRMTTSESLSIKQVTVSIGGASTIPQHGESGIALIEIADKALYEAKRRGKNQIVMGGGRIVPAGFASALSSARP